MRKGFTAHRQNILANQPSKMDPGKVKNTTQAFHLPILKSCLDDYDPFLIGQRRAPESPDWPGPCQI